MANTTYPQKFDYPGKDYYVDESMLSSSPSDAKYFDYTSFKQKSPQLTQTNTYSMNAKQAQFVDYTGSTATSMNLKSGSIVESQTGPFPRGGGTPMDFTMGPKGVQFSESSTGPFPRGAPLDFSLTKGAQFGDSTGTFPRGAPLDSTTLSSNRSQLTFDSEDICRYTKDSSKDPEQDMVVQYILQLRDPEKREAALSELSKKRENFPHLAPLLWHSVGTIAIFLQEIAVVYQFLQPAQLNNNQSSRICSVLGLLQCLALHGATRQFFLRAHIPLFLYPFLNTSNKSKAFENLRVTSLGVIGALVKGDDPEAINFLMQTEIIPLCLRIMKKGQELSRTVATFIVQKILLDDNGLSYICQTPERFFAVSQVLQTMIEDLQQNQKDDQRLLRHIIRCYLRLSENQKAGEVLKKYLPPVLKDPTQSFIKDDVVKKWHNNLLQNLGIK